MFTIYHGIITDKSFFS